MILVLSTEDVERSTDRVTDWLHYYGAEYKRINGETLTGNQEYSIKISNGDEDQFQKFKNDFGFTPDDVSVIWYRRWNRFNHLKFINKINNGKTAIDIYNHLSRELNVISISFFNFFENAAWVDHPKFTKLEKPNILLKAKEAGLKIPETLITNSKKELKNFLKNKRVITKGLADSAVIFINNQFNLLYTIEITNEQLEFIDDYFHPSLFQALVEKRYEIRVFFLNGICYSMAIFSQTNDKTKIDFRQYDKIHPNRCVPYALPLEISEKIQILMKSINLTSGSIDLILSNCNDYIFLEVNPIGQFGMVSYPCNYNLEQKFAEYLISIEHEKFFNRN